MRLQCYQIEGFERFEELEEKLERKGVICFIISN